MSSIQKTLIQKQIDELIQSIVDGKQKAPLSGKNGDDKPSSSL
jgi:hypothetical protein